MKGITLIPGCFLNPGVTPELRALCTYSGCLGNKRGGQFRIFVRVYVSCYELELELELVLVLGSELEVDLELELE